MKNTRFYTPVLGTVLGIMLFSCSHAVEVANKTVLVITEDTILDPTRVYGRIEVRKSNVTIDGRGAWLIGSTEGNSKNYKQTAISASGVSGVTLKNINAKGWETGLHIADAKCWTVEGCNFSDNFHDPEFGWGENGRRGGILLERVTHSKITRNRANRVWDACVLVGSNDNLLAENDFSHTSNTCLKMWDASRNTIRDNNLSYGIRIKPGEVHARDSTCVLLESGSNDNRVLRNDCTHGGDGIFVRVLNAWISTGNLFEGNDCSYANNNCVEAWSPRNRWIGNKANHGSYGFWLGASDQNVLIGNEASFNGLATGNHNSPHLPGRGHAGIVFMFGPSSHTIVRDNKCQGNNGAGIAAIGDERTKGKAWNAFHWIIERNRLAGNRWGIYLQHTQMIDLAANQFSENSVGDVELGDNVVELIRHTGQADGLEPPQAVLEGPSVAQVGIPVVYDASKSRDKSGRPLTYRWRITPDVVDSEALLKHTFAEPGFRRLAVTVNNGLLSDLAWRDVYVVEELSELGTEGQASNWSWIDSSSKVQFAVDSNNRLIGATSIVATVKPYGGGRVTLRYTMPTKPAVLQGKTKLVFWLKTRNENVPAWQDVNPLIRLVESQGKKVTLTPVRDFLSTPPYNEAREGWTYFSIPLAGNEQWKRDGDAISMVKSFDLGFDSWGAPPLKIWIDGLGLK